MNALLREYLSERDYKKVTEDCVAWIREWFSENGPESPAVIGISGGKDSTTVAALCAEAKKAKPDFRIHGIQPSIDRNIVFHQRHSRSLDACAEPFGFFFLPRAEDMSQIFPVHVFRINAVLI